MDAIFSRKRLPYVFILPAIIVILVLLIYPFIYAIYISLCSTAKGSQSIEFIGISNYVRIVGSPIFWRVVENTVVFVAGSVGISFGLGLLVALLLNSLSFGANIYLVLFVIPLGVPPVVAALTLRTMFQPMFGVVNFLIKSIGLPEPGWATDINWAMPTVILFDNWYWTPFMILVLYAGLKMLPQEPFEAASIDGASKWQKFVYITLPMLKPVLVVAVIFRFMQAFKSFDIIYTVTKGGPGYATQTLVIRVFRETLTFYRLEYGAVVGLLMLLVTIVVCQRLIKILQW